MTAHYEVSILLIEFEEEAFGLRVSAFFTLLDSSGSLNESTDTYDRPRRTIDEETTHLRNQAIRGTTSTSNPNSFF